VCLNLKCESFAKKGRRPSVYKLYNNELYEYQSTPLETYTDDHKSSLKIGE